jgi:hypothetical protein
MFGNGGTSGGRRGDFRPMRTASAGGHHRGVFFAEQVRVGLPMATAAVRLANLTKGGGLAGASHRAYLDGAEAVLRVGPVGDVTGLAKLVQVRFLDPAWSERRMSIGFRWEAAGGAAALFPILDADLVLSPASPRTCTLACSGVYRPPLGRVGAVVDRVVMSHVAAATIRGLLEHLAAEIASPSPAPSPQVGGGPIAQPTVTAPEPGYRGGRPPGPARPGRRGGSWPESGDEGRA